MRRLAVSMLVLSVVTAAPAAMARQIASPEAATAPQTAPEPELNPREAALQSMADIFARQTRVTTDEINAVLDAGGEEAEIRARTDAILAPFERLTGVFSEEVAGFLRWQADEAATPEDRDEALAALGPVVEAITSLPRQLRIRVNTVLAARAEAASTAP